MPCRGVHFAITDDDLKSLREADSDDAVLVIIQETTTSFLSSRMTGFDLWQTPWQKLLQSSLENGIRYYPTTMIWRRVRRTVNTHGTGFLIFHYSLIMQRELDVM